MKVVIVCTTFLILAYSGSSWSEEVVEVKNMGEMLAQIKLEKRQMENMVDKLVVSGRLSPEHAVKVKREIASVKEEDAEQIKSQVATMLDSQQKN